MSSLLIEACLALIVLKIVSSETDDGHLKEKWSWSVPIAPMAFLAVASCLAIAAVMSNALLENFWSLKGLAINGWKLLTHLFLAFVYKQGWIIPALRIIIIRLCISLVRRLINTSTITWLLRLSASRVAHYKHYLSSNIRISYQLLNASCLNGIA